MMRMLLMSVRLGILRLTPSLNLAPSPLAGEGGGGGNEKRIPNRCNDAVGIAQHVVVPEAEHGIAIFVKPCGACFIGSKLLSILSAATFNNHPLFQPGKTHPSA